MRHKRVVVVTSDVPFVEGGHITIARNTVQALRDRGFEADLVTTPQNRFGRQFSAYLANRLTDLGQDGLGRRIHQVISFRFPSYAVKHQRHICWLNHRLREYYDLWPDLAARLSSRGLLKERVRRFFIQRLDTFLLKHNVTRLFAQSKTIQDRLRKWGGIPSEVLYPPPPQREYRTESYGDFILAVSRLQRLKRIHLLVEAFRHLKNSHLKAVILGDGPERVTLARMIRESGQENRIRLLGPADDKTLIDHYSRCLAVYFGPLQEDFGLVTVEAFASRKAVITADDSGGPAELVKNGQSGFVVAPHPEAIAHRLDELAEDRKLAERLGQEGYAFISRITWDHTVEKLILDG